MLRDTMLKGKYLLFFVPKYLQNNPLEGYTIKAGKKEDKNVNENVIKYGLSKITSGNVMKNSLQKYALVTMGKRRSEVTGWKWNLKVREHKYISCSSPPSPWAIRRRRRFATCVGWGFSRFQACTRWRCPSPRFHVVWLQRDALLHCLFSSASLIVSDAGGSPFRFCQATHLWTWLAHC